MIDIGLLIYLVNVLCYCDFILKVLYIYVRIEPVNILLFMFKNDTI